LPRRQLFGFAGASVSPATALFSGVRCPAIVSQPCFPLLPPSFSTRDQSPALTLREHFHTAFLLITHHASSSGGFQSQRGKVPTRCIGLPQHGQVLTQAALWAGRGKTWCKDRRKNSGVSSVSFLILKG